MPSESEIDVFEWLCLQLWVRLLDDLLEVIVKCAFVFLDRALSHGVLHQVHLLILRERR